MIEKIIRKLFPWTTKLIEYKAEIKATEDFCKFAIEEGLVVYEGETYRFKVTVTRG